MGINGFIYKDKYYSLGEADWVGKKGVCDDKIRKKCKERSIKCKYEIPDGEKTRCDKTLIAHSCKHVLFGNDREKESYIEAVKRLKLDENISDDVPPNKTLVENYDHISKDLLKDAVVSVTGERKDIRFACNSRNNNDGLVDFLGYSKAESRIGILSSFFNFSSAEAYTLYFLTYQRYYEKKKKGSYAAPTLSIRLEDIDNPEKQIESISVVEESLACGKTYYSEMEKCDYSLGVIYHFFLRKHRSEFEKFYNVLSDKIPAIISSQKKYDIREWKGIKNIAEDEGFRRPVRDNENVYASKLVLDYIHLMSAPCFEPFLRYGSNKTKYCPSFGSFCPEGSFYKGLKKECALNYELAIQYCYLQRKKICFKFHYWEKYEDILGVVRENKDTSEKYESVADYTAFSFVNYLVEYFFAVFTLLDNCEKLFGRKSEGYLCCMKEFKTWKNYYDSVKKEMDDGGYFQNWLNRFEYFFDLSKKIDAIKD